MVLTPKLPTEKPSTCSSSTPGRPLRATTLHPTSPRLPQQHPCCPGPGVRVGKSLPGFTQSCGLGTSFPSWAAAFRGPPGKGASQLRPGTPARGWELSGQEAAGAQIWGYERPELGTLPRGPQCGGSMGMRAGWEVEELHPGLGAGA